MDSGSGLTGLNQDSLNSMLPDGVYQDSRRSISGAWMDFLRPYNGSHLERGPCGVHMDS